MELLMAVAVVVAVSPLLLDVGLATCAADRPGFAVDEVPAVVKKEAGYIPGHRGLFIAQGPHKGGAGLDSETGVGMDFLVIVIAKGHQVKYYSPNT